ncbi:uncharacterized protein LOC130813972 [Amaranthus tricolor]|uniref:uncharacterized protein LOC130813972 n=1 Tax=Amaranthus tricolor TaxID=29722 RepID=UPI00258D0B7D|nr:uncharacterized protein LOC130813972 [Amaranthus tricolor]
MFKKTIQKTKKFFLKTLQNLKTFLFGTYENIPKTLFINPLSCNSLNQSSHHLEHIHPKLSNFHQSSVFDKDDQDHNDGIHTTREFSTSYETNDELTKKSEDPRKVQQSSYILAQKMKDLEMIYVGDVDHTLDIEEALHYYSRITCPVYVEMVNKFFMDMYTDFHVLQPGISIGSSNCSKLGPLSRQPSSRGIGPLMSHSSIRICSSSRKLGSFTLCLE